MARLKLVMLPDPVLMSDQRLDILTPMTAPGNPFRLTALELAALIHLERDERQEAIARADEILQDAQSGAAQRQRLLQLKIALGGAVEAE